MKEKLGSIKENSKITFLFSKPPIFTQFQHMIYQKTRNFMTYSIKIRKKMLKKTNHATLAKKHFFNHFSVIKKLKISKFTIFYGFLELLLYFSNFPPNLKKLYQFEIN